MGKRQTVWLDSNHTTTAADVHDVDHCDAFIRRLSIDIEYLLEDLQNSDSAPRSLEEFLAAKDLPEDIPRQKRQALFFKKLGLRELEKRRKQLLRRN